METKNIWENKEQTFFKDEALDRAFGVVMALATEVYVLRDRQKALERLLVEKNLIEFSTLDSEPSEKERIESLQDRKEFTEGLLISLLGKQQYRGKTL